MVYTINMKSTLKAYRTGAMGAILDEYERAMQDMITLFPKISQENFLRILDPDTPDPNCQSIQTILQHVIDAGYSYTNYIRERYGIAERIWGPELEQIDMVADQMVQMFEYLVDTSELIEPIADDDWMNVLIRTRWAEVYDLEQLLEHAIVHLLRHRRQLEKFILQL